MLQADFMLWTHTVNSKDGFAVDPSNKLLTGSLTFTSCILRRACLLTEVISVLACGFMVSVAVISSFSCCCVFVLLLQYSLSYILIFFKNLSYIRQFHTHLASWLAPMFLT